MAFSCFEFLIVLIISFLSVQAQGNYHPYGGTTPRTPVGCSNLITSSNVNFFATSSSHGPDIPVLNSVDYWCSAYNLRNQSLTVDLGFVTFFDRLLAQGEPSTNRSVSQYFVLTSINGINYTHILGERGGPRAFRGPLYNGDQTVDTNLTAPVQARYVQFNPREPMIADDDSICMRVGIESCQIVPAAVDGAWSQWSQYGPCSQPCLGTRRRTRTCTDPAPEFGGNACEGVNTQDQYCNDCVGKVDGGWSVWGMWSGCSTTCGLGQRSRQRACNNPYPSNGGANCTGSPIESGPCQVQFCPVDGGWSAWSGLSRCSRSCGGGQRYQSRTCSNPFPGHGGRACVGIRSLSYSCNTHSCPVDGGWSAWSGLSRCSRSCGGGRQYQSRTCSNPFPGHGGRGCVGVRSLSYSCNTHSCPVDGGWSAWSGLSRCSRSCGGGQQYQSRTCSNPFPGHGGRDCVGVRSLSYSCNTHCCPVHGGWSAWRPFSSCTLTCGGGTISRTRVCNSPTPSCNGNPCLGSNQDTQPCNQQQCPPSLDELGIENGYILPASTTITDQDGGARLNRGPTASQKTGWCASDKHQFLQIDLRTTPRTSVGCTNLITSSNAKFFATSSSDGPDFPILNSVDYWCSAYNWRNQSLTVDLGFVTFFDRLLVQGERLTKRSVSQYFVLTSIDGINYTHILGERGGPRAFRGPLFNGDQTVDTNLTAPVQARYVQFNPREPMIAEDDSICMRVGIESCQIVPAAVDGAWSQWSQYGPCSKPCLGTRRRTRTCTDPTPVFGGNPCEGVNSEDQYCSDCVGKLDGGWSVWGEWSGCSTTCGLGQRSRQRTCNNPSPSNGGANCTGSPIDSGPCQDRFCPADGGWSAWSALSRCTRPCGGGRQYQSRTCSNPFPGHGGRDCVGVRSLAYSCNTHCCPVHGGWSRWVSSSSCTRSCGGGTISRTRVCNSPTPSCNGNLCPGSNQDTQPCNQEPCPRDGIWTEWTLWTQCSQSCDGIKIRNRTCDPPAAYGGKDCKGISNETSQCNVGICSKIVNGSWSMWSSWGVCSASCSPGGTRSRNRSCSNPAPAYGGNNCTGNAVMYESCNNQACPINGNYSNWGQWTACSVTCGQGTRERERLCNNPPPAHGGSPCQGLNRQLEACSTTLCPVNGNWSSWGSWSNCSSGCGPGKKYRYRECDNPAPANNGMNCTGPDQESGDCNLRPCPVDGNWSPWRSFPCSATCGQGTQKQVRRCDNPAPKHGGQDCFGNETEQDVACNKGPCPSPASTTSAPTTGSPTDSNIPELDLVFALSATSSNQIDTYNSMRDTINRFINTYGSEKVHYSIIIYGNFSQRVISFNHTFPPNVSELQNAIGRRAPISGPTVLKNALQETQTIFKEIPSRPNAKKVLVVFTDSNSPSTDNLVQAVKPLENDKILVISVGVGDVDRKELLTISPNPLDVLSVQPTAEPGALSKRIMDRILRRDIPLIDIGFALSATSSAFQDIFSKMKNIIRTIIERYGVERVKFSLIVYGQNVTTVLGDFERRLTQGDLINYVNSLQQIPGNKNLDSALLEAERIFRQRTRPNSKKVFVVLTDSVSTLSNANSLLINTAELRKSDVFILSVGFGSQTDQVGNQMNSVVFAPRDYIAVPNYTAERDVVVAETIMFKALEVNLPLIDLTFALSSSSISSQQTFKRMKDTIQSLGHTYGIDRIHYGVIVFGSVPTRHLDFSYNIPDQDELIRKVSPITRSRGSPNLVLALREARLMFQLKAVRPYARKVLVVIMDSESSTNKNDLNEEVRALRNRSVLVIGVGIGTGTLPKDLGIITNDERNTIQADINKNPDELAREIINIILRTSGLSEWSSWGACSKTCRYLGKAGTQTRTRDCKIPELGCGGTRKETVECNRIDCKGCGQRGPLNESAYTASSNSENPAFLAALNTSDPSAWCLTKNEGGGYVQLDLGELIRVYRVATKGEQQGDRWVISYYLTLSEDGETFFDYKERQSLSGNTDSTSVAFNDVNTTRPYRYIRFHPVNYKGEPCMQAAVFGCNEEKILPPPRSIANQADAGKGILIVLWILAGILTFLLLMACCYYCCWHVCCGRGKKKKGLVYRERSMEDDGYLINDEKRWTLGSAPMTPVPRVREDEIQEVTIEMKEDTEQPLGVIQFGIETDETKEKQVTAEDVKSEKPKYSEEASSGTIKSGSTMMRMKANDSSERRKRTKSEGDAIDAVSGDQEWPYLSDEQGTAFTNEAFVKSQEQFFEPPGSASFRGNKLDMRRSLSADELATLDYDLFEDRRGPLHTTTLGRDGYMRMHQANRGSLTTSDAGREMGTVDVAIGGIRVPNSSEDDPSNIYDTAGQEIHLALEHGGRSVYPLEDGGYRGEEWYSRGGSGPGQLREEGFQEIHVEQQPLYAQITFGDEDFAPRRV